ncbi:MAG: GNAT family N-acetyltransferase, partial [Lachnospiraceae bacterium]|nr:GNAT family N-acetyltransferase [Lachnospiraceae bacterium]
MNNQIKEINRQNQYSKNVLDKYEFRSINQDETNQAVRIEQICFPPNEACSEKSMKERIKKVPELFLVAVDKETGKLAGFLNGVATDEDSFRDEFFTDAALYKTDGKNVMLLGLDVLPEYRGQGLARELVSRYSERERKNNRRMLYLTCLDVKVKMYKKMGFKDLG